MTEGKNGSLTVTLALTSMMFLIFYLVLTEGVRMYFAKWEAQQAMEMAGFSVLSEYQQELFEHYGLFFLDLDYEQGHEMPGVLEGRLKEYFQKNAEEAILTEIRADRFQRASDGDGAAFLLQAAEQMKRESGYQIFETLFEKAGALVRQSQELPEDLWEKEESAAGILGEYKDEEGKPLFQISLPRISFPSVDALTEAVFGSEEGLSEKEISPGERLLDRELCEGSGKKSGVGVVEMQMFHAYLLRHFGYYGIKNPDIWKDRLEYQIEYVIFGKEGDRENLEETMWRIFLLRSAGNYLFFHQDAARFGKAEAEAAAIAGITGNVALVSLVREILLIAQAIEEGIQETKAVFAGEKVPLYEDGVFQGIQMGYEEYLYLFLCTTGKREKTMRSMDVVELEVREKSGYEAFRMDHCTDAFELHGVWQLNSLFLEIPLIEGGIYENTIDKKVCYEK